MLLNILQYAGPPPKHRIIWPNMSVVPRLRKLRDEGLNGV